METVSNFASSASRALWGEPSKKTDDAQTGNETGGREPIAGETGDVEAGEPYDKGNIDSTTDGTTDGTTTDAPLPAPEHSSTSDPSTAADPSATADPSSTSEPISTDLPGNTASTGPIRPEHDTEKTGVTSHHNPTSAISSDKPTSSNDTSGPGATPSVGADPSSAAQDTQKQQGADRPTDEPVGSEEHERIKETKKEAEEAANVDTAGPGPRSLEDKVKNDGGSSGVGGGEEDGPQKESHGKGTGEKYVKSSGLQADGGDFDASNPGAGKEADRLLEKQGVHHTPGAAPPKDAADDSSTASSSKVTKEDTPGKEGKVSLKDKIKAKLHKN